MARLQSLFAPFIKRHTEALEMLWRLATCVSDIPERRSSTTCSRLISSRARPICRPSSFALRIPDLTRSATSDLSSSAIAEMIVTKRRPIGPLVSTFSRRRIDIMHCQYDSHIAGDRAAPSRRSRRVLRRMKHLLHSVHLRRIQPRREFVMVSGLCGERCARDRPSDQRLDAAVAAQWCYAKASQAACD
jgi:hypothetical protein